LKEVFVPKRNNDAVSTKRWTEKNKQFGNWPEAGKEYHFATSEENWPLAKRAALFFYMTFPIGLLAAYVCLKYPTNDWVVAFTQVGGISTIALDIVLILYGMIAIVQFSQWLKQNPDVVIVKSTFCGGKQFVIFLAFAVLILFTMWICGGN
jgi:hypothetical protein